MNTDTMLDAHAFKPIPPLSLLAGRALRRKLGAALVNLDWTPDFAKDVAEVYAAYGIEPKSLNLKALATLVSERTGDYTAAVKAQDTDKAAGVLGVMLYVTYSMALQAGIVMATPAIKAPPEGQLAHKQTHRLSTAWLELARCIWGDNQKKLWRVLLALRDEILAAAHEAGIYMPLVWEEIQRQKLEEALAHVKSLAVAQEDTNV